MEGFTIIDVDPDIPMDPVTGDPDWLGVRDLALQSNDWYGHPLNHASDDPAHNYRFINWYYIYAFLVHFGYSYYAIATILTVTWYESACNGAPWGSCMCWWDWEVEAMRADPQVIYPPASRRVYPADYLTLPDSGRGAAMNDYNTTWLSGGSPVIYAPTPAISQYEAQHGPSYGIFQATPWQMCRMSVGVADQSWLRWWPSNTTLQFLGFEAQRKLAMETSDSGQHALSYEGEWINDRKIDEGSPWLYCTWDDWATDAHIDPETETEPDFQGDLGSFRKACFQFLNHFNHAGSGVALWRDDERRVTVYNQYVKPALAAWEGRSNLLQVPLPEHVDNDLLHIILYTIMKGGQKRGVSRVTYLGV
jgi:hypothetical protein